MLKGITASLLILASAAACSTPQAPAPVNNNDDTVTIWFVRHGKTLLNTLDRVQGWADSPLTADGRRVAEYLGAGLKDVTFDAFYASDAGRQRETMKIIVGQLGLSGPDALFARMKAGTLTAEASMNALANADPSGMTENYQQVKQRTQAALHTIINNALTSRQKNILAISSGTALQIMISDLTDNPQKNKPLPNSSVVKLVYQHGKIDVTEIGDMQYIAAGKKRLTAPR